MKKLSRKQIVQELKKLNGWKLVKNSMKKKFKFKNFVEAIDFVNKIVPIAEEMKHHPDLEIKNYNELIISLTTHDEDGITNLDIELASKIENLLAEKF